MSPLNAAFPPPRTTDVQLVHGIRYRWNFTHDMLEVMPFQALSWHRSAFTELLRETVNDHEVSCHISEDSRLDALTAAFKPLIGGQVGTTNSTTTT